VGGEDTRNWNAFTDRGRRRAWRRKRGKTYGDDYVQLSPHKTSGEKTKQNRTDIGRDPPTFINDKAFQKKFRENNDDILLEMIKETKAKDQWSRRRGASLFPPKPARD